MPAKTNAFIKSFLNKFPATADALGTTLIHTVGSVNPKLYELPSETNSAKVQEFLFALSAFETLALNNDVTANVQLNRILQLMTELELTAIRPKDAIVDGDWLMFVPTIKDQNTPVKVAAVLVFRFGFIIDRPTDDPNYTVGNLSLVSEHTIADGAERLTADIFLKGKAKFILANFFRPHTVINPDYDESIPYSIQHLTDPAHSDTTIFLPMLKALIQEIYREIPIFAMHGMGADLGNEYQILLGNGFGALRNDGWRSFTTMLALAFAENDYFTTPENELANKPSPVVCVQSYLPNTIMKGGQIVPVSSNIGELNGAVRRTKNTISSNVTGHMAYFSQNIVTTRILSGYKCSDRFTHVETTGYIRNNKNEASVNRDLFVETVLRAMQRYKVYDPAIQDPHNLDKRFIEISQNMKRYGELFKTAKIASYKKNQAEKYAADTEAYAAIFASNKQLPPLPPSLTTSLSTAKKLVTRARVNTLSTSEAVSEEEVDSDCADNDIDPDVIAVPVSSRTLRFVNTTSSNARLGKKGDEESDTEQPQKKQKMAPS